MKKSNFPFVGSSLYIQQKTTADEAMRLYKSSGKTGGDISKAMGLQRPEFSRLVNGRRDWTFDLCEKFLKAIQP